MTNGMKYLDKFSSTCVNNSMQKASKHETGE